MARFRKDVLAAGTYKKAGEVIRVRPEDLKTALDSYSRMREKGYRVPVILEHSKPNDPGGLPFKTKKEQPSARDLLKYQEGWDDGMRINEKGVLEADLDVRGKDGLKLTRDVGTYVSPQFGRWRDPETGEELPMAITHFALTASPVDISQDPEFRELPEFDQSQVAEASQLSHLVSFSMADMIPDKKPFPSQQADDNSTGDDDDSDGDNVPDDKDDDPTGIHLQMPDNPLVDPAAAQVLEMLKEHGVVLPDGTEISGELKVLLAGLMSAAHAKAMAAAGGQDPNAANCNQPQPGQNPNLQNGQDPRLAGTKQENMITMSQTNNTNSTKQNPAVPSASTIPADVLKTLPEYIQMSQQNDKFAAELSRMKRKEYEGRVERLQSTGRITATQGDAMRTTIGTYQFSTADSATEIVKLDAQLEFAESLPEGAVWSPDQRIQQMSMVEHKPGSFFNPTGTTPLADADEDKELDSRIGALSR